MFSSCTKQRIRWSERRKERPGDVFRMSDSHFGSSQWIRLWSPHRLCSYPSSVKEKRGDSRDFKALFHGFGCERLTCLEEDFNVLARSLLFEDGVRAFPHHVVDGLHYVQHFLGGKRDKMELAPRWWQNKKTCSVKSLWTLKEMPLPATGMFQYLKMVPDLRENPCWAHYTWTYLAHCHKDGWHTHTSCHRPKYFLIFISGNCYKYTEKPTTEKE